MIVMTICDCSDAQYFGFLLVWYFRPYVIIQMLNIFAFFSQHCSEAPGICEHNVFIYLVDYWVLLGIFRWSIFSTSLPSALLVCALSLSLSPPLLVSCLKLKYMKAINLQLGMLFGPQALYNFPWIWRVLCGFLRCTGLYYWDCCLLLPSMYYCPSLCRGGPGLSSNHVGWMSYPIRTKE